MAIGVTVGANCGGGVDMDQQNTPALVKISWIHAMVGAAGQSSRGPHKWCHLWQSVFLQCLWQWQEDFQEWSCFARHLDWEQCHSMWLWRTSSVIAWQRQLFWFCGMMPKMLGGWHSERCNWHCCSLCFVPLSIAVLANCWMRMLLN